MKKTGLILSGGGARAAYQVGVLKAIYHILPRSHYNPFDIISGTSAGAINGLALASYAEHYRIGIKHLERIWSHFECHHIYHTDLVNVMSSLFKLSRALIIGRRFKHQPASLLNNEPLEQLLMQVIKFDHIQKAIDSKALHAVAINCSCLTTGESVSFFQGQQDIKNWNRPRRIGHRTQLSLAHLIASSAIPMVFPAVKIKHKYYTDGAVRQLAPISPTLHLGADKVMVIGVNSPNKGAMLQQNPRYPSPGRITGHMLDAAFLDSMETDVERLERINRTLDKLPHLDAQSELRKVDLLHIRPSKSIDDIASEYAYEMPKTLRLFLDSGKNPTSNGAGLLSYLLFSRGFCNALIELGYQDTYARKEEINLFFSEHIKKAQAKREQEQAKSASAYSTLIPPQ